MLGEIWTIIATRDDDNYNSGLVSLTVDLTSLISASSPLRCYTYDRRKGWSSVRSKLAHFLASGLGSRRCRATKAQAASPSRPPCLATNSSPRLFGKQSRRHFPWPGRKAERLPYKEHLWAGSGMPKSDANHRSQRSSIGRFSLRKRCKPTALCSNLRRSSLYIDLHVGYRRTTTSQARPWRNVLASFLA